MSYFWFYLWLQLGFSAINYLNSSMEQCITNVPYFDERYLVLDTLNGKIKGSCEMIKINDTTNSQVVDYVISWKSL